ncbi:MAG: peptidoglycan-binding protein [Rhodocyclaceae bacterium]|nr:peptidoglycan-binding protein [Rhodocyclaceae bacterium]
MTLRIPFARLATAFLGSILAGCSAIPVSPPENVRETLSPTYPVRTLTGFTEGLACMDQMFIRHKVEPIYVTAAPIPDYSESRGGAGYGARDMMISAISEMSKESAAIRFVAFDRQTPDIVALQSSHPKKGALRIPDFFIRGAVTQINTSPYTKQRGGSLNAGQINENIQGGSYSGSASVSLSSVSLDLALGLVNNYQILPGVFSANTFSVEKRGASDEISISLKKLGAIFSTNENRAEALSRALRALVEVGTIELFGKLYNLPYWECLAAIGEVTPEREKARSLYASLSHQERAEFVLATLRSLKMAKADTRPLEEDGSLTPAFRRALMQYRMRHNVFGDSGVDFAIFERAWKDNQHAAAAAATPPAGIEVPKSNGTPPSEQPKLLNPSNPAPADMKLPPAPAAPVLPPVSGGPAHPAAPAPGK